MKILKSPFSNPEAGTGIFHAALYGLALNMEAKGSSEVNKASHPKWCLQATADAHEEALFQSNQDCKLPSNVLACSLVTYVTAQGLGRGRKAEVLSSPSGCVYVCAFS